MSVHAPQAIRTHRSPPLSTYYHMTHCICKSELALRQSTHLRDEPTRRTNREVVTRDAGPYILLHLKSLSSSTTSQLQVSSMMSMIIDHLPQSLHAALHRERLILSTSSYMSTATKCPPSCHHHVQTAHDKPTSVNTSQPCANISSICQSAP